MSEPEEDERNPWDITLAELRDAYAEEELERAGATDGCADDEQDEA